MTYSKLHLMLNNVLIKGLAITLALSVFAQATNHAQCVRKADIRGLIADQTQAPLSGATVMLLAAGDSTLVSFAATDAGGGFLLKNVSAGDYLLKISYVGFATLTQTLEIGAEA
jgi:hypothetical protein